MRIRLLPATIITAALLLCVKISDVIHGTESLIIPTAEAEQPEKLSNVSTEKPKDVAAPAEAEKKPEAKTESAKDAKPSEAKSEGGEHGGEKKAPENPNVSSEAGTTTDHRFTSVEVELLQSLAKRREELNRWENNIQIKEAALEATQKRIDDKIMQIEAMKKEIAALLAQYNSQEDAKIRSLVKIYENMKPSEAARIFDEVEMPILLLVIDTMSEKKAAPILAAMNPKKAKQLTVELANERKMNTTKNALTTPGTAVAPATPAQAATTQPK